MKLKYGILTKVKIRGYGSVGRAMRSQRIGQGFESPYLHHKKDTQKVSFLHGGKNIRGKNRRFARHMKDLL